MISANDLMSQYEPRFDVGCTAKKEIHTTLIQQTTKVNE